MAIPFCRPNRSKDMTLQFFYHFFSTRAFLSASVDPPLKESTDSGLNVVFTLTILKALVISIWPGKASVLHEDGENVCIFFG